MKDSKVKGVALYFQVENYIRDKITSNEWPKGYKLPSEPELAKQLNVSRSTIRQAIADLAENNMLTRKQGKGTYVTDTIYAGDMLAKYLPDEFGKKHSLISIKYVEAPYSIAEHLRITPGTSLYEVKRIRYLKDEVEAAMLETSYFEIQRFPNLHENNFNGNVRMYDLLREQYQIHLQSVKSIVEPTVLRREEAEYLDSEKGRPVLLMTRICYTSSGIPVIVTKSLIHPDKCRLIVSNEM